MALRVKVEGDRPKEEEPIVISNTIPDGIATKEEAAGALDRFNKRTVLEKEVPTDPDKFFDNKTEFLLAGRDEVFLGISKQRGFCSFTWGTCKSSTRTAEEFIALTKQLYERFKLVHGEMPLGGILSQQCPYLIEHKDQESKLIAVLTEVWGAKNIKVLRKPTDMTFPVEDENGNIVGESTYKGVLAYYLPYGRISIGVDK